MEILGYMASIVVGIFILVVLITIHELGHGIVARRNGVVVEEFGIGFPPRARGKKIKKSILGRNVLYSLNWLPIGGFVKLQGEYDAADQKGDYGAATFWQKSRILLAGVGMNWLVAAVLFTVLALVGMPKVITNQFMIASDVVIDKAPVTIDGVTNGLPAELGGIRAGDILKKVVPVEDPACQLQTVVVSQCDALAADEIDSIIALTKSRPGERLKLVYVRDKVEAVTTIKNRTAAETRDGKGYIGVKFSQDRPTTYRSTWSAPIVGVGLTGQLSWETLKGVGGLFTKLGSGLVGLINSDSTTRAKAAQELGDTGNSVAGPIGIVFNVLPNAVTAGLVPIVLLTAIISLTLAVMNVLPIPALDGGRWYTMALFRLFNKPLTNEIEEKINSAGMMIVLGLIVLVTIADVSKIF